MIALHGLMLTVMLIGTPLLITLLLSRRRNLAFIATMTGCLSLALMVLVAISLHLSKYPITRGTLTSAHGVLFAISGLATLLRKPSLAIQITRDERLYLLPGVLILLALLFPYTYFTGIDTYKWQDIASSVGMEGSLAWVAHPLSLLGFTPRSYPSAYPIQLATIQLVGSLGIEYGFYVASIFTALLATASAYSLGQICFNGRPAIFFALLYALSPVCIRYTHWATGRGLFLALLPAFLALFLALPKVKSWLGALCLGSLLCLSHKVGLITVPLFLMLSAVAFVLPRRSNRFAIALFCLIPIVLAAAIVSPFALPFPAGQVAGLLRYSITRFSWMVPVAVLGLMGPDNLLGSNSWRKLFPGILVAIPLAYERHMYGALIALPFVTLLATHGTVQFLKWRPKLTKATIGILAILTLSGALATIVHRSRIATSPALRQAALFLEHHNPRGPFRIVAPGRARTQVQAYVSGCPRICVSTSNTGTISMQPPPSIRNGTARETLSNWINYTRGLFTVSEIKTSWYGKNPMTYYFVINGEGTAPDSTREIYNHADVVIYEQESR
jgi:hypothetical protein